MSDKKLLINHLKNDIYCRIGISKVSGVGVIAIRDIPKGTIPFKNLSREKEKIIKLEDKDLEGVNTEVKKILKDFFGDSDTKNYDVLYSGPNYINISFYMNHSDKPNIDIVEENEGEYFNFVANRNIKKGEELFINYNDYK